jgi:hypothetical protein
LLVIALLRRRRPILPIIARRWPILLVIALLRRRRTILLVIATGRRTRTVSVGRGAIARPIVARRGRRSCWTYGSPEEGERKRREGQRADNDATDEARAATVIATVPIVAAMTPAGVCR